MSKIIIQNDTTLSDLEVIQYVSGVIRMGRISNHGKQYCYHSAFEDGISVTSYLNKKSDRFVLRNIIISRRREVTIKQGDSNATD